MTIPSAPIQPQQSLLPWGLIACTVIAGPSLLATAQAAPALTAASVAIGLTALIIGFALWQRNGPVAVAAPVRRRIQPLGWPPP